MCCQCCHCFSKTLNTADQNLIFYLLYFSALRRLLHALFLQHSCYLPGGARAEGKLGFVCLFTCSLIAKSCWLPTLNMLFLVLIEARSRLLRAPTRPVHRRPWPVHAGMQTSGLQLFCWFWPCWLSFNCVSAILHCSWTFLVYCRATHPQCDCTQLETAKKNKWPVKEELRERRIQFCVIPALKCNSMSIESMRIQILQQ